MSDWSSDVGASDLARGLAVGVEGDVEVGAEDFGRLLGLLDGDGRQQHRQSARRIERLRFAALDRDAALAERVDHAVEQRLCQPGQRLDRQLFGAEFDEQGCGRSEENTSELQSLMRSSYAVFC